MKKAFKNIIIGIFKLYKMVISPLYPATCRHTPTCSTYMIEAIHEWGVGKGIWLGLKRLGKCHPWGSHGYDPVPKKNEQDAY